MPSNTELYQNAFAFRHTINLYKGSEEQRNHMFAVMYIITYKVKPNFCVSFYCSIFVLIS